MSHATFLQDTLRVERFGSWWVEMTITDPTGSPVTLRFSRTAHRTGTRNGAAQISLNGGVDLIPAHARFERRIRTVPSITQSMWREGAILSSSLPSYGQLVLENGDRGLDTYAPKNGYVWAGGRVKLYFFDAGNPASTIAKVFDGRLGRPSYSLGSQSEAASVTVPVLGREDDFSAPLHSRVYRGTSYMLELFGDRTVDYGAPSACDVTGNLTLERWLWFDGLPTAGLTFFGWTGSRFPFNVQILTPGPYLRLLVTKGGVLEAVPAAAITFSAQRPYHIAIIIEGRDVTFLVWDDDAQTLSTLHSVNAISSSSRDSNVGGTLVDRSGSDATFKPWMDESRIWNYARTPDEIAADRHRPLTASTGIPATCVHRVGYDDGTGTTVTDSSATAAHGTISGGGTSTWLWAWEGGPELAGTPKPDTLGHKFGMRPVLVAPLHNGYQAHWGSTQSIAAHEGGAPLTMAATAASMRAFIVAAAPAAGNALPYLARGLFKLPAVAPVLPISAIVEGAKDGAAGYVESASRVSRYLATERGRKLSDPSEIDTGSYTTFQAGFDPVVGVTYYEPRPLRDALDLAMRSGGGWWGFVKGSTLLHVERYTGPAGSLTFLYPTRSTYADETQILDIVEIPSPSVVYEVEVRYHYNDVVMRENEVASTVKGTASWTQWTKPYLYDLVTDQTLKAAYEGKGGKRLIVETAIYSAADAHTLGLALLAALKGDKTGYRVTLRPSAYAATIGQTEGLMFRLHGGAMDGTVVMGLDGTGTGADRFAIVTTIDQMQEGVIVHEVMP